jgi:hypothetical protein
MWRSHSAATAIRDLNVRGHDRAGLARAVLGLSLSTPRGSRVPFGGEGARSHEALSVHAVRERLIVHASKPAFRTRRASRRAGRTPCKARNVGLVTRSQRPIAERDNTELLAGLRARGQRCLSPEWNRAAARDGSLHPRADASVTPRLRRRRGVRAAAAVSTSHAVPGCSCEEDRRIV